MNKASLTYTFDENEVGYATYDGKIVASHNDIDELEKLAQIEIDQLSRKPKKRSNKVIVNPSGLKGTVLGKPEPGLWSDEVSVRFENGEIRRLATVFIEPDESSVEKTAATEPSFINDLNSRLSASYTHTREALVKRTEELEDIIKNARLFLSGKPSFDEEKELDSIVVAAENELDEVDSVLDHLATEEANEFKPPQPYKMEAVEQESVGNNDKRTWLDDTVQQMIDESRGTDYEKLLSEGPALFVNDLPTSTLADAGATQQVAAGFVQSKVSMIQDDVADEYRRTFLARVEEARKDEYKERTANIKKEAADKKRDLDNVPDDGLFL